MKCQILFSGKNEKNISTCLLLKSLPRVLSIKDSKWTSIGGIGKWQPYSPPVLESVYVE